MKKEDLQHIDYVSEFIGTLKDKKRINKNVLNLLNLIFTVQW